MGTTHTYRYINVPAKPPLPIKEGTYYGMRASSSDSAVSGTYVSGTAINIGSQYGAAFLFAPSTSSGTFIVNTGANRYKRVAGFANGVKISEVYEGSASSLTYNYSNCDLIVAETLAATRSTHKYTITNT